MFCKDFCFALAVILFNSLAKSNEFLIGQEAVFTCQVKFLLLLEKLPQPFVTWDIFGHFVTPCIAQTELWF